MTRTEAAGELHGHQTYIEWQGQRVKTLAALWPDRPRAVIVGINPTPDSVDAGHYYQGGRGTHAFNLLRRAGVLAAGRPDWEDDAALGRGIGFTDLVPRPTVRASAIPEWERDEGRPGLFKELSSRRPALIITVFQAPADKLLGIVAAQPGRQRERFEGIPVFYLPRKEHDPAAKDRLVDELATLWREIQATDEASR